VLLFLLLQTEKTIVPRNQKPTRTGTNLAKGHNKRFWESRTLFSKRVLAAGGKKQMKILNLIHAYWPAIGGSEYLMQQVSEFLAVEAGDDVTVLSTFAYNSGLFTGRSKRRMPENRGSEVIGGVKVKRFPVIRLWARLLYFNQYIQYRLRFPGNGFWRMLYYGPIAPGMRREVENFDGDIIVSAPFPLNHMGYGFKNKKGVPVVLVGCMHTADRHGFHNPRIKKLIGRADGYVALSAHEKEFLVGRWGIDADKIEVIGVGIQVRPELGEAVRQQVRQSVGANASDPVIAFVGQHGLHKGINTLLDTMPTVWKHFPAARLVIAGGTTPFTQTFKRRAAELDSGSTDSSAGKRIHFIDNVSDQQKYEILESCDIFASPSGFESFGITILEAWMKRKPVVACNIEATRNLITDGHSGLLVEYENTPQLSDFLIRLIREPALRESIGTAGYEKFKKNYTSSIIGNKYRRFYDKILANVNQSKRN
jgi:glycosyltransferase involved in cell wall biosynthesis